MTDPRMSNALQPTLPHHATLRVDAVAFVRERVSAAVGRVGPRRALVLSGVAAAGAGLALNWNWLTAVGVAPIILSLAPCAAMCALGLCMHKMAGDKACTNGQGAEPSQAKLGATNSEHHSA